VKAYFHIPTGRGDILKNEGGAAPGSSRVNCDIDIAHWLAIDGLARRHV